MPLAGPPTCGSVFAAGMPSGPCRDEGDSATLLRNARWVPYVIGQGALDELVPVAGVVDQVRALDELGYRYEFFLYPGADHLGWAVQDRFDSAVDALPSAPRERDPGHVTYTWYPNLTRSDYGIGATGAYWLGDLRARSAGPGEVSTVDARSLANPDPAVTVERGPLTLHTAPLPAGHHGLRWLRGARPAPRQQVVLDLANVRSVSVDLAAAGLRCGTVRVSTDGPADVTLTGLAAGARVAGGRVVSLDGAGTQAVTVRCG
jgi:hypothetical protein